MHQDTRQTAAPVRPAEPTPTLRFIAGEHAERVAALWPAPHGRYLEMPAQRRHLAHIVLALAPARGTDMARDLEGVRADAVVRAYLGAAPSGFLRALGRLGEQAWTKEDYLLLFELFCEEGAGLVLRQSETITPERLASLAALPARLRAPAVVRHLAAAEHARVLAQAYAALALTHPPASLEKVVDRWARAKTPARLFEMAAQDLAPWRLDVAPFPEHPDFVRLDRRKALEDAGRRFRNCLLAYHDRAAEGQIALYEWAGPPPAAVSLVRDGLFGWRLEEARGVGNETLEPPVRAQLIAVLAQMGVRVGASSRSIVDQLRRAGGLSHGWIDDEDPVLAAFGVQ